MLISDLETVFEKLAPKALAEPGDNCGLLVGDREGRATRVLVALELSQAVLDEAVAGGFDTLVTHHPLLFSPLTSLLESRSREGIVRELVRQGMNLFAQHTNLDSAESGLAAIAAEALELKGATPLRRSPVGWVKFVGFVPPDEVEKLAAAAFAAGAGVIGEYEGCAFAAEGRGWFTPGVGAHPAVGQLSMPERTPEVRWETVVPRARLGAVVDAYIAAHPYEEPAFDVYPLEDVTARTGLGRKGVLQEPLPLAELADRVASVFALEAIRFSGDRARTVRTAAVLPGSGRSLMQEAAGVDVLITGDLGYHDAEKAESLGLALIDAPHGTLEWWCLRRWVDVLRSALNGQGVEVTASDAWRPPWSPASSGSSRSGTQGADRAALPAKAGDDRGPRRLRIRVDGGSRGNPGPGAIGVVLEDEDGRVLEELGRVIGTCTNNVAEYRALLAGLEIARRAGAEELEVFADSELLVKQLRGEYRVKNEGLKPLYEEATGWLGQFRRVWMRHVPREENAEADRLVNKALDEAAETGL